MVKKEADSGNIKQLEAEIQVVSSAIRAFANKSFRRHAPEAAKLILLLRKKSTLLEQRLTLETRANKKLVETNQRLKYDRSRLRLELRRAFGFGEGGKSRTEAPAPRHPVSGKRGAPKGHLGRSRQIPESWDAEHLVPEAGRCPCGCAKIVTMDEYDYKYVEDIIPTRRTVTRLRYRRGRCAKCGRTVRHPDVFSGPPVVTGKNLAAHLTVLRQTGITYRQLATICEDTLGMPITAPGVLGIIGRASDRLNPTYELMASCLPEQEALHADETGWKVRGNLHYLWVMCNRQLTYYHVDKNRSSAIPENLLGAEYKGTVVCDFYGAYNFLGKTQRCLVHLLRDIRKERQLLPASVALENFEKKVKNFIEQGKQVRTIKDEKLRIQQTESLRKELIHIGKMKMPAVGKGRNLTKRILKYQEDIFRFVEDPELEWHNNRAERQIRPLVVSRKMSFGSDTIVGARKNCVLHSVVATCKLQKIKPLDFIKNTLRNKKPDIFANPAENAWE